MKKVLMIIMDGFGLRDEVDGNAVIAGNPTNFNKLWEMYPHAKLHASGEEVGLNKGQFGNSEIGHMTIGAGRVVKQGSKRIDEILEDNKLLEEDKFKELVDKLLLTNNTVHLMYMISNSGVHSYNRQALKIYELLVNKGITKINFHLITDGRDSGIKESRRYISEVEEIINKYQVGKIVSICGRYYAMDRDSNYERTRAYYNLVCGGIGLSTIDLNKTIDNCYEKNIFDEFIPPVIIDKSGVINDGEVVLWLNFRADRARQIMRSLTEVSFDKFPRKDLRNLSVYSLLEIEEGTKVVPILDKVKLDNTLGSYISQLGLSQARIAETEKFAHVTYFFDGGEALKLDKSDHYLIPSPKVATYDLKPEMSAVGVTKRVIVSLEEDYDFILVNYANPDMVGHTGNMEATKRAVNVVDQCLGKLYEVALDNFYTVVILSDHGNADIMIDEMGQKVTTHTTSLVPFIITDNKIELEDGTIAQVAPSVLKYMDINIPLEMRDTKTLFKEIIEEE